MANRRHGGLMSACGLMTRLRHHFHVSAWSLFGAVPDENLRELRSAADEVHVDEFASELGAADHVLFYMNDYPPIFGNYSDRWRQALRDVASVQIVFNRNMGTLHREHWLAERLSRVYFHDSWMRESWRVLIGDSPLAGVGTDMLAPPADLSRFLAVTERRSAPLVIGRLAGQDSVPRNAVELYGRLSGLLPEAQFWFMPAPAVLEESYGDNSRFRFLRWDAMDPAEFLASCHIYALTFWAGVPVPGPRALMEAMAAGCAPVVIDREGPRDRVVHGESGFRTNDDDEFIDYVARLARDEGLRQRIAAAARERARQCRHHRRLPVRTPHTGLESASECRSTTRSAS
jgi:glycosyltransferase involved in cell wall biosynthesis